MAFFPLTIQFVLKSLTGNDQINIKYYQRIKEFYNDDGWFKDGIDGGYDYYNAWGFYYSLYWLSVIEPDFDKEFISAAIDKFNAGFQYFIGPSGVPLFGRSLCYRLAVTAPLIAGASIGNRPCSIGQIKRSLSCSLSYYIKMVLYKMAFRLKGFLQRMKGYLMITAVLAVVCGHYVRSILPF